MREEQQEPITEEQVELNEEEEKAREDALVELLGKVNLNDPVVVEDARGNEVAITKEQFINFYLPDGISQLEAFHCFQQVRASGLNPLIKGQCHFFKTGDGPVSLFTGYEVYLARAYGNGMEHMEEPVWEIGDDGLPISCTLTIHIKGRPDFTRTTRYAEVVGLYNGKPNKRWDRAPFQMTEKCTTINTLRLAGIAAVDDLPYAIEEMGDPVVDGHRTLTQEQLDTLGVEEEPATPGEVTATHQIDLTPLHKIYRGKLEEREIFPNDAMRKMWQSEIIGKESTADWDAMDFNDSTSEIESGRCEKWVQDKQPKPDPGHDLEPNDPPAKTEEATGGDDFLENSPNLPPKHAFLFEGDKRFATIEKLEAWCKERISLISWDDWTDENFEAALPRLLEVPLLVAQDATDDTAQGDAPPEAEEGQEQTEAPPEWDVTSKTRKRIGELLVELKVYNTPRSPEFKARIKKLIGRELLKMQAMMEAEGQAIIASLSEELDMVGTAEDEGSEPTPPEDPEAWFDSPEYAETLNAYMIRAGGHFADVFKSTAWHQEQLELNGSPRFWPKAHFDQANAALDELDLAETTKREPADVITDEQKDKIKELMEGILPTTLNPHLSPHARGWISEAIGYRSPGIVALSKDDADKVIVFLDNKLKARQQAGNPPA